MEEEIVCYRWL